MVCVVGNNYAEESQRLLENTHSMFFADNCEIIKGWCGHSFVDRCSCSRDLQSCFDVIAKSSGDGMMFTLVFLDSVRFGL